MAKSTRLCFNGDRRTCWRLLFMATTASIALSGMNAAQVALNASAHNIANQSTAGFRRQEVVREAQPQGGVVASTAPASAEGSALERDVVSQLQAKNAFLANLAVFKATDQMAGSLLKVKA
jgi:flagellar hook protein FlgE